MVLSRLDLQHNPFKYVLIQVHLTFGFHRPLALLVQEQNDLSRRSPTPLNGSMHLHPMLLRNRVRILQFSMDQDKHRDRLERIG